MSLLSIRLPAALDERLAREAASNNRAKSDIARDAIDEYLRRHERGRFLSAIARAARTKGESATTIAEEALPLDNEAWTIVEGLPVREAPPRYRAAPRRRTRRR
jgi:predicted transcriptional regulator